MQVRAGVQGESACKPASVPRRVPGVAAIHLGPALPPASCGPPGDSAGPASGPRCRGRMSPIRPCSGWGLPSRPVTRPLVRSYRTVSPLPPCSRRVAVCSLWHCPAGRPDWRLASTLPCGGRTFLDPGEPGPRPPSRLPLPDHCATPKVGWRRHTGSMVPILAVAFILVPLAELAVLIAVGDWIGLAPTLVLLLVVSLAGAWLTKREGLAAWRRFQLALAEGRVPTVEVADGAMILLAGALLLTPGFLSDVVGILLLLPPT